MTAIATSAAKFAVVATDSGPQSNIVDPPVVMSRSFRLSPLFIVAAPSVEQLDIGQRRGIVAVAVVVKSRGSSTRSEVFILGRQKSALANESQHARATNFVVHGHAR